MPQVQRLILRQEIHGLRKRQCANLAYASHRWVIPRRRRALSRANPEPIYSERQSLERQSLEHQIMATLEIEGRPATVDEDFPELLPEQQQVRVIQMAASLSRGKHQDSATRDGPMSSKKPSPRLVGTRI
jgi:hypothetical protein